MKPKSFRVVETCGVCRFATFGYRFEINCTKHDFNVTDHIFESDLNFVCDEFEKVEFDDEL